MVSLGDQPLNENNLSDNKSFLTDITFTAFRDVHSYMSLGLLLP